MESLDVYDELSYKMRFRGSKGFRTVLEAVMTPLQASMVLALPGTIGEVADKTGVSEEEVRANLDGLYRKAAIIPTGSYASPDAYRVYQWGWPMVDRMLGSQSLDRDKDHAFLQAAQALFAAEVQPLLARLWQSTGSTRSRIVPSYGSIKYLPDVLPYENFHALLEAQDLIAAMPCGCRMWLSDSVGTCDHTVEAEHHHCLAFGGQAEFHIHSGIGKRLSLDEALDFCDAAERDGLLHAWPNHSQLVGVGLCCQCCTHCMVYATLRRFELPFDLRWQKSRYEAYVSDRQACAGCPDCLERCYFDAIEMVRVEGERKLKPAVDAGKCLGCGLCVVACQEKVMKIRVVRPPEFIPAGPVDQPSAH